MRPLTHMLNQSWNLGRRNDHNHLRLYPNPGFTITVFGRTIRWNMFYGWKVTRSL